jgi:hypothetical protein
MFKDESSEWLHTLLLVLGLVAFCWYIVRYGIVSSAPPAPPADVSISCGSVVERCRAATESKFEPTEDKLCLENKGRRALEPALREPLSLGDCVEILPRLSAACPGGCRLEGGNYLIVPSKLNFQMSEHADESGRCWSKAEQTMTVRGSCVRKEGNS